LVRSFAGTADLIPCDHAALDLASPEQIRDKVREVAPHVIINAGAYTAVDRAESEMDRAMAINARAPGILAEEAARSGALLVHYSTDYVFDGLKSEPWIETDVTNPLNAYGASKLAGEDAIRKAGDRYLIFRTSWVYAAHGKNFLLTMLRLGRERDTLNVVDDQTGAPTTAIELARATRTILSGILTGRFGSASEWTEIYHMTCAGAVSWCGFARAIFVRGTNLLNGRMPQVNPIKTSEFPTPAARPHNSVLSNDKLHSRFGVRLAPWESALDEVLDELSQSHQGA
jgi:dTDP-4-dehydrorhamnose reductase